MSRHAYTPGCSCDRCTKEAARRDRQAANDPRRHQRQPRRRQTTRTRRPAPGTQEWAETRGDDLGESPDY